MSKRRTEAEELEKKLDSQKEAADSEHSGVVEFEIVADIERMEEIETDESHTLHIDREVTKKPDTPLPQMRSVKVQTDIDDEIECVVPEMVEEIDDTETSHSTSEEKLSPSVLKKESCL